jgi:signal transduction histidine kinase
MDLETRFVLVLSAVLGVGTTYLALAVQGASIALALTVALGIGLFTTLIAHFGLFNPIRRLVEMARAVRAGDFSERLRFGRGDEIGTLAFEMDAMCDQLEAGQRATNEHLATLDQLRHSDRIATLGRLASSVAHELGNPLNVIELRAQLIASDDIATSEQVQYSARVIVEQTRRMTRIIDEILSFARIHPAKTSRLDLRSVLRKAIAVSEHTARRLRTRIAYAAPAGSLEIDGDADRLLQVFVNLIVNAAQAMPEGGEVRVRVHDDEMLAPIDDPTGAHRAYLCIVVSDDGVGIPAELVAKVFEPFISTKVADGGTGLGLSVAQGIAREHDGWISVESELGDGASFKVLLPTPSSTIGVLHAA